MPRFGVSPTFKLYCPTQHPTVFVGELETIKIHLVLSLQRNTQAFILLTSPSHGIQKTPVSQGVSEQINDNNVLSFLHAVPPLVPSVTKGTFLRKGLSQVRDSACHHEQEQTCMWVQGVGVYSIACEQKQFKSQKHLELR